MIKKLHFPPMRLLAILLLVLPGFVSAQKLTAVISTSYGDITIELNERAAPTSVASFVNLAQRGYYDGLTFHRVEPKFMIQGGDPLGTGTGGPGCLECGVGCDGSRSSGRHRLGAGLQPGLTF